MLAIIDADGLAFHSLRDTVEASIQAMDEKIDNLFKKTQATQYIMCISKGGYFRHEVYPIYKEKRKQYASRSWVKTLKAVLEEKYNAIWMNRVEADDLCVYFYLNEPGNKVLCSPDKDLLTNIPSSNEKGHFNYSYALANKEDPDSLLKGWWVSTPEDEADYNFWVSMISGDVSDGITGIPKKGPKAAEKLLKDQDYHDYPTIVLNAFMGNYGVSQGIFEFQKTFRALHLLRTEEDYEREVGISPDSYLRDRYEEIIFDVPGKELW